MVQAELNNGNRIGEFNRRKMQVRIALGQIAGLFFLKEVEFIMGGGPDECKVTLSAYEKKKDKTY